MMPVPTHLMEFVVPNSPVVDEEPLRGKVQCVCGSIGFHLLYPGQTKAYEGRTIPCVAEIDGKFFFLLKAKCTACAKEILLLDKDVHGWNGFVCHDPQQAALPRPPLVPWPCLECGGLEHRAAVEIYTEGKQDFITVTAGEIEEDRWPDAFGWFTVSIECTTCGNKTSEWVSYETM